MAKKRATGEGNIYQREDGRWVGRLSLGKDSGGNRQRKVVYGKTQAEVLSKLDSMREQRSVSPKSLLGKDTLGAYLKRWLENDVEINSAANTFVEYEMTVKLFEHVRDNGGSILLRDAATKALSGIVKAK